MKNNIKLISLVVCLAAIILSCCSCGKCKDGEHKFKATTIKDATCTDEGLVGYKCDKCGYEEEKSTSAMGHNYTQQSTTATCTKDGKATYKCSRCGDVKELRLSKNLTQTQLAERMWVKKSIISAYETDARPPSLDMLIKYAKEFNVTTDYLLGLQEHKSINVDSLTDQQINILNSLILEFSKE